jgi:hypothetical protein
MGVDMKWYFNIWLTGIYVSFGSLVPAQAQAPQPATECVYSGEIGLADYGDPVRFDLDADGRVLTLIHNVDKASPVNYSRTVGQQPTCRLKLDCVVSRQGLKNIGVETVQPPPRISLERNVVWVRIGFSVAFQYDKEADKKTCHVVGIEPL